MLTPEGESGSFQKKSPFHRCLTVNCSVDAVVEVDGMHC
jgi:hypothetical protein